MKTVPEKTVLTLRSSKKTALTIIKAVKEGRLKHLGVVDARLRTPPTQQ